MNASLLSGLTDIPVIQSGELWTATWQTLAMTAISSVPVSYTHLTLPTILLV